MIPAVRAALAMARPVLQTRAIGVPSPGPTEGLADGIDVSRPTDDERPGGCLSRKRLRGEVLGFDQLLVGELRESRDRRRLRPQPARRELSRRPGQPTACHRDPASGPVRHAAVALFARLILRGLPEQTELAHGHTEVARRDAVEVALAHAHLSTIPPPGCGNPIRGESR